MLNNKSVLITGGIGSIINIVSIYATNAPDYSLYKDTNIENPDTYSASKGGLVQLTRWMSSILSPGGIYRNKFVKRYEESAPLRRMACEAGFKGNIAYLASDLSMYVTGQNLVVDGGWTV
jgi:NAD(P)-dependent dehydrogenase (short-subunit alcohol dehydrogenase family)